MHSAVSLSTPLFHDVERAIDAPTHDVEGADVLPVL
jgi:hypothetical protein